MDTLNQFCRRCGRPGGRESCVDCGPLVFPRDAAVPGDLGATVLTKKRRQRAVVVGKTEDKVRVLFAHGDEALVKARALGPFERVGQEPTTRQGALLRAASGLLAQDHSLREAIVSRIRQQSDEDQAAVRSLAVEAARLGEVGFLSEVRSWHRLPEEELAWWELRAALIGDDTPAALTALERLPTVGYPGRLICIAHLQPHLSAEQSTRVARLLDGYQPTGTPEQISKLALLDELGQRVSPVVGLGPWLQAGHDQSEVSSLARSSATEEIAAVLEGLAGSKIEPTDSVLDLLTPGLLDDLIEAGAIGTEWAAVGSVLEGTNVSIGSYVAARTDPRSVPDVDLAHFGFHLEAARRVVDGGLDPQEVHPTAAALASSLQRLGSADADEALDALAGALQVVAPDVWPDPGPTGGVIPAEALGHPLAAFVVARHPELAPTDMTGVGKSDDFGATLLLRAKNALYDWRFDEAEDGAKKVLAIAELEAIRDEALNLLAAAKSSKGDDAGAVAALRKALEGEYTLALQTNLVAVARGLDPQAEADQLASLIQEAPTPELRLAAARRGIDAWLEEYDEDETLDALPEALRDGLRALLRQQLPPDDLHFMLQVLYRFDEAWLADNKPSQIAASSNIRAVEVYHGQAVGDLEMLLEALKALISDGQEWASRKAAELARAAADGAFESEDPGGVGFAVELLDAQLPLPPHAHVVLAAIVCGAVGEQVAGQGEAQERFIDYGLTAFARFDEVEDEVQDFLITGCNSLVASYLQSRAGTWDDAAQLTARIGSVPSRRLNRYEARQALAGVVEWTDDTARLLSKLRKLPVDEQLDNAMSDFFGDVKRLAERARRLKSRI